jgi:quinoprotein glucose dehydrogenase
LWAIGQILGSRPPELAGIEASKALLGLLQDREIEIRANAARVIGNTRDEEGFYALCDRVRSDTSPRVRHLAAIALGRLGAREAVPTLIELLRSSADQDPVLRHAASYALALIGDVPALLQAATDSSEAVRLGAVIALRRLGRSEIATFLQDQSPRVVLETARAINDEPVSGALSQLAALIDRPNSPEPLLRRVLNANYRFGTKETATALARFANTRSAPASGRRTRPGSGGARAR